MSLELETPVCDLCGTAEQRVLFDAKDRRHGGPGEFHVVECPQCTLRYVSPRPVASTIGAWYPDTYSAYRSSRSRLDQLTDFVDDLWHSYLRLFLAESYPIFYYPRHAADFAVADRASRLLDVGCGRGDKLRYIRRRSGWETYGVDFSPLAVEVANARGAGDVRLTTGDRLPFDDDFFDAVMSWHSLEHHYSPRATLREVARVIRPGGYGIISVPSGNNVGMGIFGSHWGPLEAPRHLYHFTTETLTQLMSEAGLTVHQVYYDFSFYGLFLDQEILESLETTAAERGIPLGLLFKVLRFEGILSSVATLPILPINDFLGRLWRGSNLIFHFRKYAG